MIANLPLFYYLFFALSMVLSAAFVAAGNSGTTNPRANHLRTQQFGVNLARGADGHLVAPSFEKQKTSRFIRKSTFIQPKRCCFRAQDWIM